jgi:thiol-disulfide isomerase/thioredoxin
VTGGAWIASYVMLWVAVAVLGIAVVALLRQIGVLHARMRPLGVHFGGEGPERLSPAPGGDRFDYGAASLTLVAFTSPTCTICASLLPGLRALSHSYGEVVVEVLSHDRSTEALFAAFKVRSTPYFVAVDRRGLVRVRGIANSLEQIEVMVQEALDQSDPTPEAGDAQTG